MTRAAAIISSREMLPLCLILDLLPIPRRFLQSLDDQGSCRGNHGAGGLPVLDLQLDSNLQTFPVSSSLGNVVTNLLGGQAKGTNLGSEGRGCSNLPSYGPQVHVLNFIWVELGSHLDVLFGRNAQNSGTFLDPLVSEWWMRAITCSPYHGVALKHVCVARLQVLEAH